MNLNKYLNRLCLIFLISILIISCSNLKKYPPELFLHKSNFYHSRKLQFLDYNYYPLNPSILPKAKSISSKQKVLYGGLIWHNVSIQTDAGPLNLNIVEIDKKNKFLEFKVVQAHNSLVSQGETLSSMADRTNAIAGINGDYFHIGTTNEPVNMTIINENILRLPTDYAVLTVKKNGDIAIGKWQNKAKLSFQDGKFPITALNYSFPKPESLVLYTSDYGSITPKIDFPSSLVILKADPNIKNRYTVESLKYNISEIPIIKDKPILIGVGEKSSKWISDSFKENMGVIIDLYAESSEAFEMIKYAIGGGPILVKDGKIYNDDSSPSPNEKNELYPVVAAGIIKKSGKILFITVDGRQPKLSIGLTRPQFAELLKYLGCDDAIAFDSGGSATIVGHIPELNKIKPLNSPSDGSERPISNGLFVYSKAKPARPLSYDIEPKEINIPTNSKVPIAITSWDEYGTTYPIISKDVFIQVSPYTLGSIQENNFVSGFIQGSGHLIIKYNNFVKKIPITITNIENIK